MTARKLTALLVAGLLCTCAHVGVGQTTVIVNEEAGAINVSGAGSFGWGIGGQGASFEMFMMTLTQLNMTPDLTLNKDAKLKLQAVRDQWQKAQAKFMEEHKDDFKKLQKEQMEAYTANDPAKIQEAAKKYQELAAAGPKGDEYIAKAKAVLSPDELKVVEEKLAKADQERKAMMEKWRAREGQERERNPGPGGL